MSPSFLDRILNYSNITVITTLLVVHVAMGCGKKKLSVAVPPAPVRVPSQRPLAPSVASVTSIAHDKGDNEMILGLCTDLLAFALQLRKTPENLSYETV